jgi:hypothetical protein
MSSIAMYGVKSTPPSTKRDPAIPAAMRSRNTIVPLVCNSPIIQPATRRSQKAQNTTGANGFMPRGYSVKTAVPLADTISMPLFAPSTS